MTCCGAPLAELVANTQEASTEKHIPAVEKTSGGIKVQVGSVLHPMDEGHYIGFIYVETKKGGQDAMLAIGAAPEAEFCLVGDDEVVAVYAWCNLHGLWKLDV